MIGIIDYGVGNVQAFLNLFNRCGLLAKAVHSKNHLTDVSHIILPGVGHYDYAMSKLKNSGMLEAIEGQVILNKIPILGICVGMQMLANYSEEGSLPGLGWLPGSVLALSKGSFDNTLPLPHMGWNELNVMNHHEFFANSSTQHPNFYFLHSYYFQAEKKTNVIATVNYGFEFDAVANYGNVFGIQCHPEKSHGWGEQFLKSFASI